MSDFDPPQEPDLPTPMPPQEKRIGFLLIAFLLGFVLTLPAYLVAYSRGQTKMQADAVRAGHAVYKVVDEFGHTKYEWLPASGTPAPEKK